jgi:hypothetical protein
MDLVAISPACLDNLASRCRLMARIRIESCRRQIVQRAGLGGP